jgi:hypothetical protein
MVALMALVAPPALVEARPARAPGVKSSPPTRSPEHRPAAPNRMARAPGAIRRSVARPGPEAARRAPDPSRGIRVSSSPSRFRFRVAPEIPHAQIARVDYVLRTKDGAEKRRTVISPPFAIEESASGSFTARARVHMVDGTTRSFRIPVAPGRLDAGRGRLARLWPERLRPARAFEVTAPAPRFEYELSPRGIPPERIAAVTYTLHPTYRDPHRTITTAPFTLRESALTGFTALAEVKFKDGTSEFFPVPIDLPRAR